MKDKKIRIAVLVSGGGTNLQALINAQKKGILKSGEICAVISSSESAYALKRAERAGIFHCAVDRKKLSGEEFEKRILEKLRECGAQIIVLAGFMCILSADFIKEYENRIINIHPSLIPSFCGAGFYGLKVHEAALEKGVKVTGATVHFVNEIPDGGKIIMQKAVRVQPDDTPKTLQKRVMRLAEQKILPAAAEDVCGKLKKECTK